MSDNLVIESPDFDRIEKESGYATKDAVNLLWLTLNQEIINRLKQRPVLMGNGTPEAKITAPVGALYVRLDGGASTTLYVKESGSAATGWVAK